MASPSLSDSDADFHRLADDLWGAGDGSGEHRHGAGSVYGDATIEAVLSRLQVPPDFVYTKPKTDTTALFVHRTLPDGDVYFVNNRQDRDEDLEATFRVSGREAEIWHADSGTARTGAVSHCGRSHDGAAPSRSVGRGVRGVPQACLRTVANDCRASGAIHRDDCWAVDGALPGGSRRARHDHAGHAEVLERERRSGSEVLFGKRHLLEDRRRAGGLVRTRRQALDRSRRGEGARGGVGQRQAGSALSGSDRSVWTPPAR